MHTSKSVTQVPCKAIAVQVDVVKPGSGYLKRGTSSPLSNSPRGSVLRRLHE